MTPRPERIRTDARRATRWPAPLRTPTTLPATSIALLVAAWAWSLAVSAAPGSRRSHLESPPAALPAPSFVTNRGQLDPHVRFALEGRDGTLFVADDALVLVPADAAPGAPSAERAVRIRFHSAPPASASQGDVPAAPSMAAASSTRVAPRGLRRLPGVVHVLRGADPSAWRTDIPTFAGVVIPEVAPGIDLRIGPAEVVGADRLVASTSRTASSPRPLRLALDVAPGADLGALRLAVEGPTVRRGPAFPPDEVPAAASVAGDHAGEGAVGTLQALELLFATYLGGSHRFGDLAYGLAVDASGHAFVTGTTYSTDFPVAGAAQGTSGGEFDAFVAKLSRDGAALEFATYLGGGATDEGRGIAVDALGRVHVAGLTRSRDFPTARAVQTALAGAQDAFAVVLGPSGGAFLLGTYYGGSGDETGHAVAATGAGATVLVGETSSRDLPLAAPIQATAGGGLDAFVARLAPGGDALEQATYLGGSLDDTARAVALGADGGLVIAGSGASTDFPGLARGALGAAQRGQDAFVARFAADGASVAYASLLGGTMDDVANGVAVDAEGRPVIVGVTASADFPVAGAWQASAGGGDDGFIARLTADGASIQLATYVGGSGDDALDGIAIAGDTVFVAGHSASDGFPAGAARFGPGGGLDALAMRLDPAEEALAPAWSARFGGTDNEAAHGVGVDGAGGATIAGYTRSDDLPAPGGAQAAFGGGNFDAFVARLGDPDAVLPTPPPTEAPDPSIVMAFARLEAGAADASRAGAAALAGLNQGAGRFAVWRANRLGGDAARIVALGADDAWQPAWSPDCRRVIYSRGRRAVVAPSPTPTRAIDPTPTDGPPPTPTGGPPATATDFAARAAARPAEAVQDEAPFDLWIADADGANAEQLTRTAWSEADPAVSPDGARIAFAADRGGQWDLYTMAIDGSDEVRLTTSPLDDRAPAWSPDGTRLAYTCASGRQLDVCVVGADGSNPRPLAEQPAVDELDPAWSPDGATVAYTVAPIGGGDGDVWLVAADGSNPRAAVSGRDDARDPAFAPDGALAFSSDGTPDLVGAAEAGPGVIAESRRGLGLDARPVGPATTLQVGRRWIWELPDALVLPRRSVIRRVLGEQPAFCRRIDERTQEPTAVPPDDTPERTPPTPDTPTPGTPGPSPTPSRTPGTPPPPGEAGIFIAICCLPTPDPFPPRLLWRSGQEVAPVATSHYVNKDSVAFRDLPALAPGAHFVVRLDGWANEPGQFLRWQSASLDVAPGERREIRDVDIRPVALLTPRAEGGPGLGFPDLAFVPRTSPGGRYVVVVRDPASGEAVWSSEPLPWDSDRLALDGLPAALEPDREYAWEIVVASDSGGVGFGGPRGTLIVACCIQGLPRPTVMPRWTWSPAELDMTPVAPRPEAVPVAPSDGRPPAAGAPRADRGGIERPASLDAAHAAQQGESWLPVGLPLAMNRHTPGQLVDFERNGGIVLSGVYGERPAPIRGPGETGIQVQNLAPAGSGDASITAAFYEQYDPFDPGQLYDALPAKGHLVSRTAAPGAAANIYLPGVALPFPSSFSALIDGAGAPLAAIFRADWPATGGAAIYSNVEASDRLVVPLVLRRYRGQNSVITIQNLSAPGWPTRQLANVRLLIFAAGRRDVAAERHLAIRQGQSVTVDLGSVHPAFQALGDEFSGSMRIVADSLIGAQALVAGGARSVSGFEGVPEERAAETLFVPLFRAGQPGLAPGDVLDTGISIVNPGDAAVSVSATFHPTSDPDPRLAACRAQPQYVQRATIEPRSSAIFYQGAGGRGAIEPPMPAPCYGSVVIRSTGGGVLAIVQDGQNGTALLSAYNAVPADQAANRVAVPLWRHDHSAYRLTTGIQVMNVGAQGAQGVTIAFRTTEPDGSSRQVDCGAPCRVDIPPGGAHTFWPGDARLGLPRGAFGAALVESPEPIAVIVNDYPLTGAVDAATYNGIPMP